MERTSADGTYVIERELMPRRQYLDELLDSLVQLQQREFQLGSDHIKRERSRTLLVVLGILSLGLLVSAAPALGLVRHLTALYRREEAAIQQAERAAAAREELLATVAHDLRSPLGAIRLRTPAYVVACPRAQRGRTMPPDRPRPTLCIRLWQGPTASPSRLPTRTEQPGWTLLLAAPTKDLFRE
jgi:signal transduction histidine kinase